jgi:hypothetical protein
MTAVATANGAERLRDAAALTDGYSAAFLGAAGIAIAGALLALALLRFAKTRASDAPSQEVLEPSAA